jgi:hypothetical protein
MSPPEQSALMLQKCVMARRDMQLRAALFVSWATKFSREQRRQGSMKEAEGANNNKAEIQMKKD